MSDGCADADAGRVARVVSPHHTVDAGGTVGTSAAADLSLDEEEPSTVEFEDAWGFTVALHDERYALSWVNAEVSFGLPGFEPHLFEAFTCSPAHFARVMGDTAWVVRASFENTPPFYRTVDPRWYAHLPARKRRAFTKRISSFPKTLIVIGAFQYAVVENVPRLALFHARIAASGLVQITAASLRRIDAVWHACLGAFLLRHFSRLPEKPPAVLWSASASMLNASVFFPCAWHSVAAFAAEIAAHAPTWSSQFTLATWHGEPDQEHCKYHMHFVAARGGTGRYISLNLFRTGALNINVRVEADAWHALAFLRRVYLARVFSSETWQLFWRRAEWEGARRAALERNLRECVFAPHMSSLNRRGGTWPRPARVALPIWKRRDNK